ncbi:MAG: type II secretion system F family protein [Planctomycetota bacterium]
MTEKPTRAQPAAPPASQLKPAKLVFDLAGVFALSIPALFLLGVITSVIIMVTGAAGILTNFFLLLGFVLMASALRRLQAERRCRLLNYLKLATEKNLPLPEFLEALQDGEGRGIGKHAGLIADELRMGTGLGDALIEHVPDIPLHQSAVIWRGEHTGRLGESVARVADAESARSRRANSDRNDVALQYALFVFIALMGMGWVVGGSILPRYQEIFLDFEAVTPHFTLLTMGMVQALSPLFLIFSVVALLGMIGWSTHGLFHTSEVIAGPLRRIFEPILWRVPVLSSGFRSQAMADASFMIEQAMRAGRPLPEAIDAARHPLQSREMDRRLERFAEHLRQGQTVPDAARTARLPALFVGMLSTATASTQPADVFAFLCRYYTERVSLAEAIFQAAALPMATLLAAGCVAWFVFALFYPLIALIEATLQATGLA